MDFFLVCLFCIIYQLSILYIFENCTCMNILLFGEKVTLNIPAWQHLVRWSHRAEPVFIQMTLSSLKLDN